MESTGRDVEHEFEDRRDSKAGLVPLSRGNRSSEDIDLWDGDTGTSDTDSDSDSEACVDSKRPKQFVSWLTRLEMMPQQTVVKMLVVHFMVFEG